MIPVGIPTEQLSIIFEPFSQSESLSSGKIDLNKNSKDISVVKLAPHTYRYAKKEMLSLGFNDFIAKSFLVEKFI